MVKSQKRKEAKKTSNRTGQAMGSSTQRSFSSGKGEWALGAPDYTVHIHYTTERRSKIVNKL
jgi:hypothetical protein